MQGNWVGQSEMTLEGPVIEEQEKCSLWLDVGRDDGLGGQWMGVARVFRSR